MALKPEPKRIAKTQISQIDVNETIKKHQGIHRL